MFGKRCLYTRLRQHRIFEAEIHGTCQPTGEGNDGSVYGRIAAIFVPGIPFLPSYTFLCHQIWEGALQSGGHHGFVIVNHNMLVGCQFNNFPVVTYTKLAAVSLFAIQQFAYIACFDYLHAVIFI